MSQRTPLPDGHRSKKQEERGLHNIQETVQKCDDTVKAGIQDLFGEDAVDRKNKTIRRVHIASNPERIASLRTELSFDLQILNNYFVLLLSHDNTVARSETAVLPTSIDGYYRQGVLQAMQYQALQQSSHTSIGVLPQDENAAHVHTAELDASNGRHLRDALSKSMTDVRTALQGFTDVAEAGSTEAATNSRSPLPELPATDPRSPLPELPANDPRSTLPELPATKQQTPLPELPGSVTELRSSDEPPYPLEALEEMGTLFSRRAAEAQGAGDWPLARRALEGLIRTRKQQAILTGDAFDNELVLEQMLLNVLLRLNQWEDALKRIATLDEVPVPVDTNSMNPNARPALREAHIEQAKALVLLDRHSKSTSRDVGLADDDVESARLAAHRAYNLHYQDVDASPDADALARFEISARLLATSLRILDRDGEADGISATAQRRCGHSIEPLANGSDTEEINGPGTFEFELEAGDEEEASFAANTSSLSPRSSHSSRVPPPESSNEWTSPRFTDAVKGGLVSEINRYLQSHPDVVIDEQDEHGWTALHLAVCAGNEELAKLLIPHTKVDTRSHNDETALLVAINNDTPAIVRLLAQHDLFTNSRFADDCNALHQAVYGNSTSAIKALLDTENGQRLTAIPDKAGMTALHLSVSLGRKEQVGEIVNCCSAETIDLQDCVYQTALDIALNSSAPEAWNIVDSIIRVHRKAKFSDGSGEAYKRYIAKHRRDSAID